MTSQTTFYFSRVLGNMVYDYNQNPIGKLADLIVDKDQLPVEGEPSRPRICGLKIKKNWKSTCYYIDQFTIRRTKSGYHIECDGFKEIDQVEDLFLLGDLILDKQIVDLNGKKLVRVNDIRLVSIPSGAFAIAVDIGIEGLLRRIGIAKPIMRIVHLFGGTIPAKFILWDDVEAVDFTNFNIKLSTISSKLHTLHPSDLADIIEDLGKTTGIAVFNSLDEEKAADVLEELDTRSQIHILESLSIEKAADVLEKMPANEAADIIDEMESSKAEQLLKEMDAESSEEVRELLEYEDDTVGGWMSTDFISVQKTETVGDVLAELRRLKPESEMLYNICVVNASDKFIATVSFRNLLVTEPDVPISAIMNKTPIFLYDTDKIDSIAELISKYHLLAIPVTDKNKVLAGLVIIDDIIEDLTDKRRTNKK